MVRFSMQRLWAPLMAVVLVAGAAVPVGAQDYTADHLAAARKAIEVSRSIPEDIDNILPNLAESTKAIFIQRMPTITREIENAVLDVALRLAAKRADLDKTLVQIWASRFTKEELDQIIAFYESPIGVKLVGETVDMRLLSMRAVVDWQNDLSTEIILETTNELKERGHPIE